MFVTGIEHLQDYPGAVWAEREKAQTVFTLFLTQQSVDAVRVASFLKATTWDARFDNLMSYLRQHKSIGDLYGL